MSWSDQDITPAILLQHMHGMEGRLRGEIGELRGGFKELRQDIKKIHERIVWLQTNLTGQIDAIDKRLDELEITLIPKRLTALEAVVFPS